METMQAILGRRSIRRYTDEPVSDAEVKTLLEAAMAAPSGHNKQPWQFIILREKATMLEIMKFHNYSKMLEQASVAIIVCGDLEASGDSVFWPQDCAAATQNILLAAYSMRLGAVWLGVYPQPPLVEGLRKLLNIPDKVTPFCIVSIGKPQEQKPPGNRFNEARIHYNKW
jgi:nitroreductase